MCTELSANAHTRNSLTLFHSSPKVGWGARFTCKHPYIPAQNCLVLLSFTFPSALHALTSYTEGTFLA